MKKILSLTSLLVILTLALAACGGGGSSAQDPAALGKELFNQQVIGTQPGCVTCHSLEPGVVIVGPSLAGIASRADEAYIRESILDPNAQVVEGFPADTMPNVWGDELTPEQVDQLVAFLLTLK
ncbi:MAG: cytochrome c [Anaerolineae bacterium]|nr:MAG: cytochrome c [Anaerolineae bacterium]